MIKASDDRLLNERQRADKIVKYTVPKSNKKFSYRRISWDKYMRNEYDGFFSVRSSIIPLTTIDDKLYWLLGSFHDYPRYILADFGGGCVINQGRERSRQSPFSCAITEVHEESKGLLTQPILKMIGSLNSDDFQIYEGKNYNTKEKLYFFFIPLFYNDIAEIPNIFNNSPDIKEKLGPLDFYLESDIYDKKYLTTYNLTNFIDYLKKL